MKYHRQRYVDHRPDQNRWGDCARTALACLLDAPHVDDVPHFAALAGHDEQRGLDLMDEWLGRRGLRRLVFAFDGATGLDYLGEAMRVWNPDVPYCLVGATSRGHNHVAIYCNGRLVHDPHPSDEGVTAPAPDSGHYWIEIVASVPGTA